MRRFVALFFAFLLLSCSAQREKPGEVWGNGRIDGDEIELSPKYPGRVVRLLVDEGDQVKKGQIVAVMDSEEVRARVEQHRELVELARQRLLQARVDYRLTREEVELQIERASFAVRAYRAQVKAKRVTYRKALKDHRRFLRLFKRGVVAKSRYEEVRRLFVAAKQDFVAAQAKLSMAEREYRIALTKRGLVSIKERQVEAARAQLERAKAALDEARAVLKDFVIRAPVDGVVIEKVADVGEVLSPGSPILVMVDPSKLYLKMFVSERDVGKIALGMRGYIYTDAYPDRPFPARVCYVAQRAEFTPKEVETRQERVHHVFAVKLCPLDNSKGLLKLGMPADGVVKVAP